MDDRTLNVQSDYLVVLVATYNRMALLSRTLDSISAGTECPHEIIVIDGGSTDGTVEYLRADPSLTKVFQGALIGTAGSYNQAWRRIESRYTCWLSDDTELVEGSLDLAVRILEEKPSIGMVGLKMKDTEGARKDRAYLGGISKYGILNCNHGVLRTELLRSVGYFNEDYRSYTIDPDLTASVLSAGKAVVMTKQISVLHHRTWDQDGNFDDRARREMGGIDNPAIYSKKFRYLDVPPVALSPRQEEAWRLDQAIPLRLRFSRCTAPQAASTRLALHHNQPLHSHFGSIGGQWAPLSPDPTYSGLVALVRGQPLPTPGRLGKNRPMRILS